MIFFALRKKIPFRLATDILVAGWLGLILGGRLGYVFFYNFAYYLKNPDQIVAIWNGGMSFHGALLGVALAVWVATRAKKMNFLSFTDELVLLVPWFLAIGRIGNFLNEELVGRVVRSDFPLAVIFPAYDHQPRHPSQLYEAFLEGPLLFWIVWKVRRQRSAVFLMAYAVLRFLAEFLREPDPQVGFIGGIFSLGQLLCLAMFLAGVLLYRARRDALTKV